jgi:hypothetical protein
MRVSASKLRSRPEVLRCKTKHVFDHFTTVPQTECDVDRNGNIDAKELHVGLLLVFDKLNQKLPVHVKPPNHDAVRVLMRRHDVDGTGALDFFEFLACVKVS